MSAAWPNYIGVTLGSGALLALSGIAFALVYSSTGIFHLAYGFVVVVGGYGAWFGMQELGWGVFPSASLGITCGTIVGLATEWLIYRPLSRRRASWPVLFIASLGVYMFGSNLIGLLWGNSLRAARSGPAPVHESVIVNLTDPYLAAVCILALAFGALALFVTRTRSGLALRAVCDNAELLSCLGNNVDRTRNLVFFASSMLGATVGVINAFDTGVTPQGGMTIALYGGVAAMFAGRRRVLSAAFAGMLLGVLNTACASFWSAKWQQLTVFVALAGLLYLQGNIRRLRRAGT